MRCLAVVLLVTLPMLLACESGTGGELVDIELELGSKPAEGEDLGSFVTKTGFEVELSEAKLSIASVYVYASEPSTASTLSRLFIGRALAHGGFDPFNGKRVRVEHRFDPPLVLDLLDASPRALAQVPAEAGEMSSATLVFGVAKDTGNAQAWVKGTALRDGETISFEGSLQLADEVLLRRVDGIGADGSLRAGGTLSVAVLPHVWFEEAHFERLLPAADDEARRISTETQVHTSWTFGARSTRAYEIEWRNE